LADEPAMKEDKLLMVLFYERLNITNMLYIWPPRLLILLSKCFNRCRVLLTRIYAPPIYPLEKIRIKLQA